MSSPPARRAASAPPSLPVLPEEVLIEIFLRLDDAADLCRVSAACTAFLLLVRFLRRNRPLYRRPVVVFVKAESFYPRHARSLHHAEPPHPSASAARALVQAADFTLSFLPDPSSWRVLDASGGRLLLFWSPTVSVPSSQDLVACDPLHHRHVRIPPIPADLTAGMACVQAFPFSFLAPAGEEEEGSPLVVIRMVLWDRKVTAFVFSSATGEWRGGVTFHDRTHHNVMLTSCRHHPHESLCRTFESFSEVLMFNAHKMEFYVIRIPHVRVCRQHAIVEAEEGRLGFLTLADGMVDLYCKAWQSDGVDAEEWQHEKTIPLPDGLLYSYTFSGVGGGYLLLQADPLPGDIAKPADHVTQMPEIHYFTLKLKTLVVERLCVSNERVGCALLYSNFLPPLSLPSV